MEYVLSIIGLPKPSLKRVLAPLAGFGSHVVDHFIPSHRNNYHPHMLGHRALGLFSALLVAVKVAAIALIAVGPVAPAFSSAITTENIISLTNESRQQYGLAGLTENQLLDKAAQTKADDMLAKGYFSHNTPDGKTPWSFIVAAGYNYLQAGENLAVNFTAAENVENAWMNSPGHKANILNKNYQEIGIGISQGVYQDHDAIFVVQMFGVPADQQVALSDQPTPVQASAVPAPAVVSKQDSSLPQVKSSVSVAEPLKVNGGDVKLVGDTVQINAQTSGAAVKVIAYFNDQAIMLDAKDGNSWQGEIAVSQLAQSNATVHLRAYDINGNTAELQLADFSSDTAQNYNLSGTTATKHINIFGFSFDPTAAANRFYLFFIASMLACLVLAIAIKRHVQHLPLVANACLVIILATGFWWGG